MATTPDQASPARRPRPRSRMMSWGSGGRNEEPRPRVDMTESPRDKARSRMSMTTKADPNKAIGELQPGQVQLEQTTIESLRSIQHKDMYGNVITDPDRSNPTRPRMERPLDTIRSFEAAAEGPYNRRNPPRPETAEPSGYGSRRSSYHQAYGPMPGRYQDESYGGRGYSGHPALNGNYGYGGGSRSPAPFRDQRRMPPRGASDPMYGGGAHRDEFYNNAQYQQSYDTATNASGSGHSYGTEPWANSTDPSSENSSFDRLQQVPPPPPKVDMGEQYGFSGFGGAPDLQQTPIMEEQGYDGYGHSYGYGAQHGYGQQEYSHDGYGQDGYGGYDQNGYGQQGGEMPPPPPPPPHNAKPSLPRAPSKLQSARRPVASPPQQYDAYGAPVIPDGGEKRKSWLKRRFSKNNG